MSARRGKREGENEREGGRKKEVRERDWLASRTIATVDHEIRAGHVVARSLAVARILTRKCGRATLPDRPASYAEGIVLRCGCEESEPPGISIVSIVRVYFRHPRRRSSFAVALTDSPAVQRNRARGGVCFRRRAISVWHIVTVCVPPPPCCQARLLFAVHASPYDLRFPGRRPSRGSSSLPTATTITVGERRATNTPTSTRIRSCALVNARRQQRGHYSKFGGSRHGSRRCHVPVRGA